jgi:16S rRNA C1402 (ribose-2'-O) methylase RsmI
MTEEKITTPSDPEADGLVFRAEAGSLYVVATPIGNLRDLTLRALDILKSTDIIAAEDTRITAKLLARYGITTRPRALHRHNEAREADALAWLAADANRARGEFVLIVDAPREHAAGAAVDADRLLAALLEELPPARAARVAAAVTDRPRDALYARALELRRGK